MSPSLIDRICKENDTCPHEEMKGFLKNHVDFLERLVCVHGGLLESMIEQKYLEEFEAFVTQKINHENTIQHADSW